MAFKNINQQASGSISATKMAIGSSVEGYVTGFEPSLQNPENMNLMLKVADGTTVRFYTAGNLKYMIKDGKIATDILTRITRTEDKNVKGKNSSQFTVEQDADQTLEDADFSAVFAAPPTVSDAPKLTTQAVERNAVATRAAELAKQAKNGKRA